MNQKTKSVLFSLAAASVVAVPTYASAQSTVTLYGAIDEGLQYTSNVKGKTISKQRRVRIPATAGVSRVPKISAAA
ncbi:porin [Paraburkholderia sp. SIMBA_053]|uniref:porin n=1 Tax=Paraburkholderia sp. SIMBA_053 TaxID=3085794 RepID=UPI00397E5CE7